MVLLVLKCHMALWRKWRKLLIWKEEFLYQLFIIMSITCNVILKFMILNCLVLQR